MLAAAPAAHAAVRHLTAAQAIKIAKVDARIVPLLRAEPGCSLGDGLRRKHTWTALLEPKGALNVLAQATVSERTRAVTGVTLTATLGPPQLSSNQAFVIASRSRAVKAWIASTRASPSPRWAHCGCGR